VIPFAGTKSKLIGGLVSMVFSLPVMALPGGVAVAQSDADKPRANAEPLPWLDSISKGSLDAQRNHRAILVRARGDSCPYCERLDAEMAKPEIRELLKDWTLVTIDIDRSPTEAQRLNVDGIPALRVLSPFGGTIASHDGYLPAAELAIWLKEQSQAAHMDRIDALLEEGEPDASTVSKLVEEFQERDPLRREAAMRRLRGYPQVSVASVSQSLQKASLSTRLVALDLLREWHAPVDGLDPWRAETFNGVRLKQVADWASKAQFPKAGEVTAKPLSKEEITVAQASIEKMLTAPVGGVAAMREQLARFGRGLLPLVYARLKEIDSDAARERLVALRYRLVASDRLTLRWPGGLERLASMNLDARRGAVDELSHLAKAEDESLLLETFSDPAPLVREIALRSLWTVGSTGVNQSLTRLLADPDPNVRAAVLKQLGEKPTIAVAKMVATYAKSEKDPDLVAHAVRVIREVKSKDVLEPLKTLLTHPSWQVRAEATEGIGKLLGSHGVVSRYNRDPKEAAFVTEGYGALIPLLKDPDPFVISRALQALGEADLATLVDPMFEVAKTHPEMTVAVVHAFSSGSNWSEKVLPRLFEFCKSKDPAVRAAAIEALGQRNAHGIDDALENLLADRDEAVRIAALHAFFQSFTASHPRIDADSVSFNRSDVAIVTGDDASAEAPGFLDSLARAFGGSPKPSRKAAPKRAPLVAERPKSDAPSKVEASDPDSDPIDQPLRDIRQAKSISNQKKHLVQLIEPLVRSNTPAERIAAACDLAAAGRDAVAVPALRRAVGEPGHIAEVAETLPWLLWSDRKDLFGRLLTVVDDDGYHQVVRHFAQDNDLRAADLLWKVAASDRMTAAKANVIFDGLQQCYLGNKRYQIQSMQSKQLDKLTTPALARGRAGSRFERLISLGLLLISDKEKAADTARTIVEGTKYDLPERTDALRILLAAQDRKEAQATAAKMLSSTQPELCEEALAFLVNPDSNVTLAGGEFSIYSFQIRGFAESPDQTKVEAPKDLKPESLLPLLKSPREKTVGYAGYLLCLLDREEGLQPLLRYWDAHGTQDAMLSRLVYRAVAQLNAESQVPLLARIYQQFHNPDADAESQGSSDFSIKDFYWTIRTMTGPQVLALRKKIREEVGVGSLSQ
jgi:HEAT repeat protein